MLIVIYFLNDALSASINTVFGNKFSIFTLDEVPHGRKRVARIHFLFFLLMLLSTIY